MTALFMGIRVSDKYRAGGNGHGELGLEAAKSILELRFSRPATAWIMFLLRANNLGKIADAKRVELEKYMRVGQLLDLLRAKARLLLAPRRAP
jgi:hypothetical protein